MGYIWGRQDPGEPHVGPINFAIWDTLKWWWPPVIQAEKCDWNDDRKINTNHQKGSGCNLDLHRRVPYHTWIENMFNKGCTQAGLVIPLCVMK